MRRARAILPILVAAASVAVAARASASDEPAPDVATARRLFSESAELRSAERWEEAADKLRQAVAIKETAGLRFHLAFCEEKSGHLVAARKDYARADELIHAGEKAEDVAALLEPAQEKLAEHIPTLFLKIPAGPPGLQVSLDGAPVPDAALAGRQELDAGAHSILVRAPEHRDFSLTITVVDGEDRVVEVALAPLRAPALPAPALPPSRREAAPSTPMGAREIVLVGEGALAVAGLGVGVVFLVERGAAQGRIDRAEETLGSAADACDSPSVDAADACADLSTGIGDRRRDGLISTIGFVSGGVLGAAFAATWFLWPKSRGAKSSLFVAPSMGARGATLVGTF